VVHVDEDLRSELEGMTPKSRDLLSRVITGDQVDRDTVVRSLMRYRAGRGGEVADIIQLLMLAPVARRRVSRVLGEIATASPKRRVVVPPPTVVR
jgi:hypothetical protein